MTRTQTLARFIKSHEDLTIAEILFIKDALLYYETKFGELEDDYELEVQCAIRIYSEHLKYT